MDELAIKIEHVSKQYRLGAIGGGTLQADLQSWWARVRGKEDPNSKIGSENHNRKIGERFLALDDINLEVKKGEALGIIGHNGAGKSTLLKLLSRVTAPTEGTISYNGRITSMLEVGTGFHRELTGRENIYMNGAILGMTKKEIDAKMEEIIDFSEVREFIDTPVKRYSSGMYVKLAFSVAAHLDSEIMIMDEVLAVGDMAFQKKCLSKMREAADKEGRTVLYVSHNMNTIRTLCDRCIVLEKGRIIFDGNVEDAIQCYMGTSDLSSFPVQFDLSQNERQHHFGRQIYVYSARLMNKSDAKYSVNEDILLQVELRSLIDLQNAQIILRIKDKNNSQKIAAALSEPFPLFADTRCRITVKMENNLLVADQYCLSFEVISADNAGNYYSYDNPSAKMQILISDKVGDEIFWSKQYWGNEKLKKMAVIENEVVSS